MNNFNSEFLAFPRIDEVKIKDLQSLSEGDPDDSLLRDLLKIFKTECQDRIQEMKVFSEQKNFESLAKVAHRFRSTCYNVGANRMGEITRKIETLSKDSSSDQGSVIKELVSKLVEESAEAIPVLEQMSQH